MYRHSKLANGIRVVTHDMKERDSAAIGILIGTGGRAEDDRVKGAAHFLEHIVFKGSKKYSCNEIKEQIEGVGGSLNAFTSEERTCFYAKVPAQYAAKAFDVLADMSLNPLIRPADMKKERTVICEEIKMYHDLPQYMVMDLVEGIIWPDHPLGKSLIGTVESVSAMTPRDLLGFHGRHYVGGNVIVAACGKVRQKDIENLTAQLFKNIGRGSRAGFETFTGKQTAARVRFFKKNTEQMHLALGMPGLPDNHPDKYALTLLHIILGGNMSSRLFNELREKRGLAYSISTGVKYLSDTGMFLVRAGVDNRKLCDAVALILKELERICAKGVTRSEFVRGKEYYLGQVLLGMEDTLDHMLWLADTMMSRNRLETLDDIIRNVAQVNPSDIRRVASRILHPDRFNLAVVGPLSAKQENKLRGLLEIRG